MCRYWHAHPHPQETESAKCCRATIWESILPKFHAIIIILWYAYHEYRALFHAGTTLINTPRVLMGVECCYTL